MKRALLTVCLMGSSFLAPAAPAQGTAPPPREGRFTWESHAGEAGARRYRLYVPAAYDGSPAPLLVMLHGCTQDPDDFAAGTRMNAAAGEHGFLVVYPEQTAEGHPQKCWSWYDPAHQERGRGEPAIVAGITREVMERFAVDPARVYVAGISAGGAMALSLAAAYPDLYAAAASHSGVAYRAARGVPEALRVMREGGGDTGALRRAVLDAMGERARPVPVMVLHGAADDVVSPLNADHAVHQWAMVSEAAGAPLRVDPSADADADRVRLVDAEGKVVVESWVVPGVGHAWSGGAPEGSYTAPEGPDATREVVRFLLAHRRAP